MSDQATLKARKEAIESEFKSLGEESQKLIEQGKALNQKLSAIKVRQDQLKGAYQVVEDLLSPTKEIPAETAETPKKK
jgi:CRISPR/Cas system CSM-associated protein Csm2 small subunit